MHLNSPRIAPLTEAELTEDQKAALAPLSINGPPLNIFKTLARDPKALTAFLAWGSYILSKRNSLPAREREIVILRIGYLCRSGYEWTQHHEIGKRSGLTDEEIERIKSGRGFNNADTALIKACDELHSRQFISDSTWAELRSHFSEKQCMDVVFTAGQYTQVSMMLNTFGVQLDPGQSLDPDLIVP
ncbi:MAG TPA: carboxymuconolactone decarboxylase family protein [Vitreimonas sp.]|jgi:alkylhydroperoxidase family enzyme|nr:carboxymuconolactone decarboxylase family protein [Vitreimonas sp.]